jgi:4-hydroxyproline epimerase
MMSGSILYPPISDEADASIIFVETSGCLPMCGHGTIGTITMALENGYITPKDRNRVVLDAPAGLVRAEIEWDGEHVAGVRIFNVASYLDQADVSLHVEGLGELVVDIAYGGNFYVIVEPQKNYPGLDEVGVDWLLSRSLQVRAAANAQLLCEHAERPDISGFHHILWADAAKSDGAHARNAVFYGERAIDRSPCGTGTSARMAQLAARGRLNVGEDFVHESLIGSRFKGRVESETRVGSKSAIMPSVQGWAVQTGVNTIFVDDRDPYKHGFVVA